MAALVENTDFIVTEGRPNGGIKQWVLMTDATPDAGDTIALTLANYGISATGLLAIKSWKHTTDGSVIATEANTCAVASGVLTITLIAGTNNDPRVIWFAGRSKGNVYA